MSVNHLHGMSTTVIVQTDSQTDPPSGTPAVNIVITGKRRAHLRVALAEHRAKSAFTDAEYVRQVLGVSLNTYKKCIGPEPELALSRQSFNRIVANAGLEASRLGSKVPTPVATMDFGGYTKAEFGYLAGRYLLYRRSFQTGLDISRAVLDISWNDSQSCLRFVESRRLKTPGGAWQANDFTGDIYIHRERVLMSLLAIDRGDARLTLLHIPARHVYGTNLGLVRTSGAVLTHGYPKRFFQPVISAVTIEAVEPSKRSASPNTLCKTIVRGMSEYADAAEELKVAEEHAVVMTPLMWRAGAPSSPASSTPSEIPSNRRGP